MCAMMPMLRVRPSGVSLGIAVFVCRPGLQTRHRGGPQAVPYRNLLPAIMCERLIGLGHPVCVFPFLHGATPEVRRIEQLVRELLGHRLAVAARACVADEPSDAERQAAVRVRFDRHLVVGAADAARLLFERRLDVLDRLLEHLHRIVARLLLNRSQAAVHDPLGCAALPVAHQRADELGDERAAVDRIEGNVALRNFSTSWHLLFSLLQGGPSGPPHAPDLKTRPTRGRYDFGLFAPYFERPCFLPCTPTASSVPRTT